MNNKYYLGLDLGISSVGWAVMAQDDEEYYIDDFGVRLFDSSENPKDGTTDAEARRIFRSARRLNRRRKQRIIDLKRFLEKNKIITISEITKYFETGLNLKPILKITNNLKYDESKYFNPYVIRAKGLTAKLAPHELAIALINIASHRGYNDKFSFSEEEKKKDTKLTASMTEAEKLIEQYGTIAQAITKDPQFLISPDQPVLGTIKNQKEQYRFLFERKFYQKELNLILKEQQKYYPQLTDEAINFIIHDLILRQRDFEVGPGPKDKEKLEKWKQLMLKTPHHFYQSFLAAEGKCSAFPQEPRAFKSSITFEIFRLISDLSTFTVTSFDEAKTKLFAQYLLEALKAKQKIDKTAIKKIIINQLGITTEFWKSPAWENFSKRINLKYWELMIETFPEKIATIDFHNLTNNFFDQIGTIIHQNITPARRKEKIQQFLNEHQIAMTETAVEQKFLKLNSGISTSTANLSFKYMQMAINAFCDGIAYGKFQADFVKKHENEMYQFTENTSFLAPIHDEDLTRNAVVFRAINQTRKVLKALFQKYGNFEVVNIEVARELAKSWEERNNMEKENQQFFQDRLWIEKTLEVADIKVNSTNVLKYRLWQQQRGKCLYCFDLHEIKLADFNNKDVLEIDHIIPQSKFSDDSSNNKVLVCTKSNREKGKVLPLVWLSNHPEHLKKFIGFCHALSTNKPPYKPISRKKLSYLMTKSLDDEILNDFAARNLNDTRTITRYITNWLKFEVNNWDKLTGEKKVQEIKAINGVVTSQFRRLWLKDSAWGQIEKVRDISPFHHAVDAMILTQFLSTSYIYFASDIVNIVNTKRRIVHDYRKGIINYDKYFSYFKDILAKWETNKVYVPNAYKRLEKIIDPENNKFYKIMSPLISNLSDIVDARIPVKLKIEEKEEIIKLNQPKNQETDVLAKTITKKIKQPKFIEVLTQKAYYELMDQLQLKGDIHYPFISYKINRKLDQPFLSSQNPINHRYKLVKDPQNPERKIKKRIVLDKSKLLHDQKSNTFWEIDNYYGVALMINEKNFIKGKWIRNYNVKAELKEINNAPVLIKKTIVEYTDKNTNERILKVFHGKTSEQVYANLLGTIKIQNLEKSKLIFNKQNYYDTLSNWKELKIIQPTILGKEK